MSSRGITPESPCPRLCHLVKWPDFDGYGFNLHAEKAKSGQYIGKVDDDSPAQLAGLREGDRIIEVNLVNIANENHRQVVERIKSIPNETKLLVIDELADKWYKENKIIVKSTQSNVIHYKTPVPRPGKDTDAPTAHPDPPTDDVPNGNGVQNGDNDSHSTVESIPAKVDIEVSAKTNGSINGSNGREDSLVSVSV
jgi:Na(+)/H(+) exchange regulatory cofactor NHE-RF2